MFQKLKDNKIYIEIWVIGLGTLLMIIWTTVMAFKAGAGLDQDQAFLSSYHEVDKDFDKILASNKKFKSKYNIKFLINQNKIIGLTYKDVFLNQRAVAKRKDRKNFLSLGKNSLEILIQTKDGKLVKDKNIKVLITQAISHKNDINLELNSINSKKDFNIKAVGYWNITGVINVGNDIGYFYIKTNASK